jgi:16S rRNA (guanine1516-N2)-methyltransferase
VIDFLRGAVGYQLRTGSGRSHPLVKAVGLTGKHSPDIVDATAGLGRDAFLLASLGARVTLVERSVAVHRMLQEALAKARAAGGEAAAVVERMTLHRGDARELLPSLDARVVLVDPMHPPRRNTALVRQEMRDLRDLVGPDPDALELMHVALTCAGERVVLKWPLRAPPLPGLRKPSHQIVGKTVRYDVFMIMSRSDRD